MAQINATQMRDAVAWATDEPIEEPSGNPFVWFWEAIEGDFNENRSTSQILVDAGVSMIPLVDQVCDVRDLIANCKNIYQEPEDTWSWVALALTLIGLFPTLGSLVKGVLKIFFGFVRRSTPKEVDKAVDAAMTWVISFLRRRDVQKYLQKLKVDEVFKWLADNIKAVKSQINVQALLKAFDDGIAVTRQLGEKVRFLPPLHKKVVAVLNIMQDVRLKADKKLGEALAPIMRIMDTIIHRLELESLATRRGIVDTHNIHFRGSLPQDQAVAMLKQEPGPKWLSKTGDAKFPALTRKQAQSSLKLDIDEYFAQGYPKISDETIETFNTIAAAEIKGPARLYRVVDPSSRGMSESWMTEATFKQLEAQANPKSAWRRFLAVWPHWNVDGQFVVYDIKAGESLKVWRGKAASQDLGKKLPDKHLEGGWEQVVFNLKGGWSDPYNDTVEYLLKSNTSAPTISYAQFKALSKAEQAQYQQVRAKINHPNISGPFETGWGYEAIDGAYYSDKIGVPNLEGQLTQLGPNKI